MAKNERLRCFIGSVEILCMIVYYLYIGLENG